MGVKDKDKETQENPAKPENSGENKENSPINEKKTMEEYKHSASMDESDISFGDSSSFMDDE